MPLSRSAEPNGQCVGQPSSADLDTHDSEFSDLEVDTTAIWSSVGGPYTALMYPVSRKYKTKPTERERNFARQHPAGPHDSSQTASPAMMKMYVNNLVNDPSHRMCIEDKLRRRWRLVTDFSGIGGAEQASRDINEAIHDCYQRLPKPFYTHRASDINEVCHYALRSHEHGPEAPSHVIRNVEDVFPAEALDGLHALEEKWKATFASTIAELPGQEGESKKKQVKSIVADRGRLTSVSSLIFFREFSLIPTS
jgi:hypothetical protein